MKTKNLVIGDISLIPREQQLISFAISAGIANAGKKFFCYIRWRNSSEPQKSGPWTLIIQGTIAE